MRFLTAALLFLVIACAVPPPSHAEPAAASGPIRRFMYIHLFGGDTMQRLRDRLNDLDAVSPVYFSVKPNGDVAGTDRADVRSVIGKSGVKIIPMVANELRYEKFTPQLADPAMRAKIIDQLVALVVKYNYDGLNIDFEAIEPDDRPLLTQFMVEFSAKMRPTGKLVTIAVPAKPRDLTIGWSGAYDYAALGAVSDYVVLMTYAYRAATEVNGSTAPMDWVARTAAFAAGLVRPDKLLLGVGFWAYDWDLTEGDAADVRTMTELAQLAKRPGAAKGYSVEDQSAYLTYKDDEGHDRVAWYEDQRAISVKLNLIRTNGLAGWAGWRLGQEGPEAWAAFNGFNADTAGVGSAGRTPQQITNLSAPLPAPAGPDFEVPGGRFYTQKGSVSARTGFAVTDLDGVPFYREFNRLGGVNGVGYPISQRFVWNGFVTQAFQKAIFQWNPAKNEVNFVNVFDELSGAGKDSWLLKERSTPRPLPSTFDAGKPFNEAQAMRLALLDKDSAIKAAYLARPDALRGLGLPTSAIEDNGNHLAIRLQRAVIQKWTKDVPWAKAGTVTIANGGDIAAEAGLLPSEALKPKPAE